MKIMNKEEKYIVSIQDGKCHADERGRCSMNCQKCDDSLVSNEMTATQIVGMINEGDVHITKVEIKQ